MWGGVIRSEFENKFLMKPQDVISYDNDVVSPLSYLAPFP
jgi:hypothetical protein